MNRLAFLGLLISPLVLAADEKVQPTRDELQDALDQALGLIVKYAARVTELEEDNDALQKRIDIGMNCT